MKIGIDFGSTYSTVSKYNPLNDSVEALHLEEGAPVSIPSAVSISTRNGTVSCGDVAKSRMGNPTFKVYDGFKMLLVETDPQIIAAKKYTADCSPRYITKCYLESILNGVMHRFGKKGETFEEVFICIPEIWCSNVSTLDGRNILSDILKKDVNVPIDKVSVVTEPESASAFFAHNYEKETGKRNADLKIFSHLTEEGKLSDIFFNKTEENKSDTNYYSNNSNTDKILLKLIHSNNLLRNNYNTISNEHKKFQLEKYLIDLKTKELKKRISMFATDKQFELKSKKRNFNNEINNLILYPSDRKSKYFYDLIKIIEKINNLNNLVNERREKEIINFSEKYKLQNLNDEDSKNHYNKVFTALFGSSSFQFIQK